MGEPLIDHRELSRTVRSGLRNGRRVGRKVWRSRAVTVLLVLVLAVAVRALSVRQKLDTQRWGAVRTVVVAKFSFAEGHRLEANDLAERPLPLAAIPDLALSTAKLAEGRTLRVPVTAGQVLSDLAIGAPKARALLSSIGPHRVAIAIPAPAPRPPVQIGDHIDVHSAAGAPDLACQLEGSADCPGNEVGRTAVDNGVAGQPLRAMVDPRGNMPGDFVVVAVTEQSITVAVSPAQARRLVETLRSGPVLVALRGR